MSCHSVLRLSLIRERWLDEYLCQSGRRQLALVWPLIRNKALLRAASLGGTGDLLYVPPASAMLPTLVCARDFRPMTCLEGLPFAQLFKRSGLPTSGSYDWRTTTQDRRARRRLPGAGFMPPIAAADLDPGRRSCRQRGTWFVVTRNPKIGPGWVVVAKLP